MPGPHSPRQNYLLAALPRPESERLYPHYESGDQLQHVYFPILSIVSLLYVMADGASAEIAVVGNEASSVSRCSWAATPCPIGR